MDRRDFVTDIGRLSVGALLFPVGLRAAGARAQLPLPIWSWLAKFASAIAVPVATNVISTYLNNSFIRPDIKQRVGEVNKMMAEPGNDFSDLSRSQVYSGNAGRFFYAAIRQRPGDRTEHQFNACAPFVDPSYVRPTNVPAPAGQAPDPMAQLLSRGVVTLMEGPSLVAIGGAAEALAGSTSREYARSILEPREGMRRSIGSFQNGYSEPDVYKAEGATISIDYQSESKGVGMVEIVARSPITGARMFGEKLQITYPV